MQKRQNSFRECWKCIIKTNCIEFLPETLKGEASVDIFNGRKKNWPTDKCACHLCKRYISNARFISMRISSYIRNSICCPNVLALQISEFFNCNCNKIFYWLYVCLCFKISFKISFYSALITHIYSYVLVYSCQIKIKLSNNN